MAYIDQSYLLNWIPQDMLITLTESSSSPGEIDTTVTTAAINTAESTINQIISMRYVVPLTSPPDSIKKMAADLALYFIYSRKFSDNEIRGVRKRYEDALDRALDIADGKENIAGAALKTAGVLNSLQTNKTITDRIFSSEKGFPS